METRKTVIFDFLKSENKVKDNGDGTVSFALNYMALRDALTEVNEGWAFRSAEYVEEWFSKKVAIQVLQGRNMDILPALSVSKKEWMALKDFLRLPDADFEQNNAMIKDIKNTLSNLTETISKEALIKVWDDAYDNRVKLAERESARRAKAAARKAKTSF